MPLDSSLLFPSPPGRAEKPGGEKHNRGLSMGRWLWGASPHSAGDGTGGQGTGDCRAHGQPALQPGKKIRKNNNEKKNKKKIIIIKKAVAMLS